MVRAKMDRTCAEKVYAMSRQGDEPVKKELQIKIHPIELATTTAELQQRLAEIEAAGRRVEEAKVVSQVTMNPELSI